MEKIVEWLINIERLANTFYSEVSEKFKADKKISGFFRLLAVRSHFCGLAKYSGE